jgi:exodeoxyribonuclease V alpha subunit
MANELRGQIDRITFVNEENGYTVARMKVEGRNGFVTVVGTLLNVTPGEVLKLTGQWKQHPRYGEQFQIESFETVVPATAKGIEKYLGSGMIKGIGPVMAKRLVQRFGVKTLNVIEEDMERLKEVDGIGEKRIEMIRQAWDSQKEVRDIMVFLQGHGVSPAYAAKIYREYGRESVGVVKRNPYRLAEDIFGIGFLSADRIAGHLGIEKDAPARIAAGIMYALQQLADDGHLFYPAAALSQEAAKMLGVDEGALPDAIGELAREKKVVLEASDSHGEGGLVYLERLHTAERGVATNLARIAGGPRQQALPGADGALSRVQSRLGIDLSMNQRRAVEASISEKVLIVTGGPGTGKTTIINTILQIYEGLKQKVLLAAPTGRAGKRMTEATGHEARTIHRLLEYAPASGTFKRDGQNRLEADLVVVDEVSMVDAVLMYHFLEAVPDGAALLLVGDADQLPSVGPGNVLRDMIDSGAFPVVRLDEIFRQCRESAIVRNAHRINSGLMPELEAGEGMRDFYFIHLEDPQEVLDRIVDLCGKRIPKRFGFSAFEDIQVIAPMHRGVAGVANINAELQKRLNPVTMELVRGGRAFRPGDKVMQVRNNYDKNVFNGDMGRIQAIDGETQEVRVDYDGTLVSYDYSDLDEITLAYAVSVHKAQGSEYPVVIVPVLTQHYLLLQRNLLYTAVTRGKKLVVLVGTKKALAIAVRNDKQQLRYSLLKERLAGPLTTPR